MPQQDGLPEVVSRTRQAIVDAAVSCDWSALEALLRPSGRSFIYSFGGGEDALGYFRASEVNGDGQLRPLVIVLRAPFRALAADGGGHPPTFAWPDAYLGDLTEAEIAPLRELYTEKDFNGFRTTGYIGWRAGISVDGTWWFFVAGD